MRTIQSGHTIRFGMVVLGILLLDIGECHLGDRPPNAPRRALLLEVASAGWQTPPSKGSSRSKLYYVSPTGSDANTGAVTAPFKTLARGCSVLRAGDTLYLREGTYTEALFNCIPGGTSWDAAVTVAAHPDEIVTIKPSSGGNVLFLASSARKYIIVRGLVLDGTNILRDAVKITSGSPSGTSHHIRLQDCEIKNAPQNGVLITGQKGGAHSDYNEIINCKIHGNGHGKNPLDNTHYHGIYQECNHAKIEGNDIYDNGGYGVHIYKSSGVNGTDCGHNKVSGNKIHDNATAGSTGSSGIGLFVGEGNFAFNNLVWNNSVGIKVDYGAKNTLVYNNTVYKNNAGAAGIAIAENGKAQGTVVRNNISYLNARASYQDKGTGTVQDHNLFDTNPLFVNAPTDFHLRPGSPAIHKGMTLKTVQVDADGVARPKGASYDVGAYQYHELRSGKSGDSEAPKPGK
jgi:hypothetical protein